MSCGACGAVNRMGARFCAGCGRPLGAQCLACASDLVPDARFCDRCGQPVGGADQPAVRTVGGGRYVLGDLLGEGARKRVHQGQDTRLGRDVAIALLRGRLDRTALSRFMAEARASASMSAHPHLVTVFDAGEEDGRPWLVSELMTGGTLAELITEPTDGRLPVEDAIAVGGHVSAALSHLHAHGLIHRDVHPGNVWLSEDGTAVLGDLGLASVASDDNRSMTGTVLAMAPEQVLGHPVDHRCDLYSLGVLLYEMVAGRPPFAGGDAAAILAQHVATPPEPLDRLVPDLPPGLAALVGRLLAKDPEERFATAVEVRSALTALTEPAPIMVSEPAPPSPSPRRYVGRSRELDLLHDALERAVAGAGGTVLLTGEPGIGKTRTAEELADAARRRGAEVLWGRCHEGETPTPYLPFVEPLRTWSIARSQQRLQAVLADEAGDLLTLLPELSSRLPGISLPSAQDPEQQRYRLFQAVAAVLLRSASETPLLLVLDDIHWADRPSLLLLTHLARQVPAAPVLVVATYRDVEVGRRHPLGDVLEDLRRERLATRVALRGLGPEDIAALLEDTAGQDLGRGGQVFGRTLHARTEGNPFFVEEIVRDLVESGAIYQVDGRWTSKPLAELGIPEGVRQVIGRRLSRLSSECNSALADAAVLGRDFAFDTLAAMGPYGRDELAGWLEEAAAASLIRPTGSSAAPTYAFTHALVRETLYEELPLPKAQRRHLAAGRAIESVHAGSLDAQAAVLARHFRSAGAAIETETAISWSLRAGELAAAVYAWEEVITHLEAALELLEDTGGEPTVVARLHERLGDLHYVAGLDYERGLRHLEQALALYESLGDADRAAQVHSRLGRGVCSFTDVMDIERAMLHFGKACAHLETLPESPALAYAHGGLASAAIYATDPTSGLEAGRRAMEVARRLGQDALWAGSASSTAWHLAMLGHVDEALQLLAEATELAEATGHGFSAFQVAWVHASTASVVLDFPAGAEAGRRELDHPRTAQAPRQRDTLRGPLSWHLSELGELDEAARIFEEGVGADLFVWQLHRARGDTTELRRLLEAEADRGARVGDRWLAYGAMLFLGVDAQDRGELEDAYRRLRTAIDFLGELPVLAEVFVGVELGRAALGLGRLAEGRELINGAVALTDDGQDWRGLAGFCALGRACLAAAEGDDGIADVSFDNALEIFERFGAVWYQVRTLRARGSWQLDRGDRTGAAASFEQALEIVRRIGAGPRWVQQIQEQLLRARGIDRSVPVGPSVELVAEAATSEGADLRPHAAPDGTLTILFSDIEDSTSLGQRLGDQRWMEVIRRHNAAVRAAVAEHGGYEVKALGDGFMVVFGSAAKALRCAAQIRQETGRKGLDDQGTPLRVRIGVHTGEPIAEGGDFYGSQVNFAARVAAQAGGGEILVSELTKGLVGQHDDFGFGRARKVELKGFTGMHAVFPLL